MADYNDLNRKIIKLGKQTLKMCTVAGSGHPSSGLSLLHLVVALMYRLLRYDPNDPWNPNADRIILSEGHAVPIIYAAYCDLGGAAGTKDKPQTLNFDDALNLRAADSPLDGHPNPIENFPFFDAATGSLGQGLSVAAGLAAAAQLDNRDRIFYCLIGDGEAREGQIAEAIDFIVDHKLTNVRMIFNCNGQGQSDYVSPQQSPETLAHKLTAYGCDVITINGHNFDEIFPALRAQPADKPRAIVARTIKGWGSSELQSANYHGRPLKENQLDQALADFDQIASDLGVADYIDDCPATIHKPKSFAAGAPSQITGPLDFEQALKDARFEKQWADKKLATRKAYGAALSALGYANERIVVLDGDVKNSTFAEIFAQEHPDRYFECRIAEQNMISTAVGLAAAGKIPFASSFGKFLIRGYDQLELAAITNANIKLCGSHVGVSLAADGPSQMALPDLAFMRAFSHAQRRDGAPAIRVFCPSDAVSAFKLTELMAHVDGICYMRTQRPDVPFIYDQNETFTVGGFKQINKGQDLLIVASGYMVHVAREALPVLAEQANISAGLIDAYSLPLQTDGILLAAAENAGRILVVEDNYIGGIADEINAAVADVDDNLKVNSLFVKRIPKSTRSAEETLRMVNLSVKDIAAAGQKMCCKGRI